MAHRLDLPTRLRLISGLTLFTFVSTHLLNHSLGLISLDAQEAGRTVFLGVWRSLPGALVLLTAVSVHLTLVLGKQVRRSTLRMPAWEGIRLLLGLITLFFVTVHGLETYGMNLRHGLKDTYFYVLLYIWPDGWWRQTILVAAAWTHGCMGVHFWLRVRAWYRRWVPVLFSVALLLPVLAWLGAWAGDEDAQALAKTRQAASPPAAYGSAGSEYGYGSSGSAGGGEYGYGSSGSAGGGEYGYGSSGSASGDYGYGSSGSASGDYGYGSSGSAGTPAREGEVPVRLFGYDESGGIDLLSPQGLTDRRRAQIVGLVLAALLVTGVFSGRLAVQRWRRRRGVVRVRYPGGRQVVVPVGTTALEASRIAGVPHAAVCGGRGRCTTCRVHVDEGAARLDPLNEIERRALARLGAPEAVRLACQIRPRADVTLTPLLPATVGPQDASPYDRYRLGSEQEIAVLFADLRGFTALSDRKLPFDVVYLLNQYFRAMGAAIEASGGHVDKFIGDGIMALFGLETGPRAGCRGALAAARAMAAQLADLNARLAEDLERPLQMGIGIHAGAVILGEMGYRAASNLTAIGDVVNVASRLESATKKHGVQAIVSAAVVARAGVTLPGLERRTLAVRGAREPVEVYLVPSVLELPGQAGDGAA